MTNTMSKIINHIRDRGIHDMNVSHCALRIYHDRLNSSTNTDDIKKAGNSIHKIAEDIYANAEWIKISCNILTYTYETYHDVKDLFDLINKFRKTPIKYKSYSYPSLHGQKDTMFAKLLWISYWFKEAEANSYEIIFREPSYDWTVIQKEPELEEMNLKSFKFNIGEKTLTVKL